MHEVVRRSRRLAALVAVTALACAPAFGSTSGVVISQVYGGNGNVYASDYVELFNGGTSTVSLTGWSVQYASAAGTGTFAANGVVALSGSLQPGQYHLVQLATTTGGLTLPMADSTGSINLSGTNGKVVLANVATGLACNGASAACSAAQLAQIVDLVGYGSANFFEGAAAAPAATATTALYRALAGCTDNDQNNSNFSAAAPVPRNSSAPLAPCGGPPLDAAIVPSCPASLSVATGAVVNFPLSASDADSVVNAAAFQSGNVPGMSLTAFSAASGNGASASVRLSLDNSVAAGSYPVVVNFSNNTSQSASCTINLGVAAVSPSFTPIYNIQGSGTTSGMLGLRTTRGVVTQVSNNGYYIQDATGDGNPATSDGIFVFTSVAPFVSPGQVVQITGTVTEFNTGAANNALTAANPVTEFTNLTSTVFTGSGSITPTVIAFPIATQGDLERYEGMLVQIDTPLTASQNFFQGRYGQVTLSANGRLIKPTNLYRPGTALALSQQDLNARSSLMLDDGSSLQNPNPTPYIGADNTLRAGDTLPTGITGVIDYGLATNINTGLAMYRIHPATPPVFTRANVRTATPPAVGGNVKVASFNVLNFFTTFTNGNTAGGLTGQVCTQGSDTPSASLCRGASNLAEFNRQRAKIVQAMVAINADVFGLMEIQNNGNTAAQNLVDALNAVVGANTYAVVPTPPTTGTDAIRVAMLYKPGTLNLSGAPMSDANAVHNRPPFAQTFAAVANGQKFSVVVNHFKSKGSCPSGGVDDDQGDGQGCWNELRKQQSSALLAFIGSVQSSAADNDVIVIGDLNAYGVEDPIDVLTTAGLVNQISLADPSSYSYVFDGEAGYLDHALATPSLSSQVAGTVHWHINADEPSIIDYNEEFKQPVCPTCGPDYYSASPYRASDHDPVIIGLNLAGGAAQTISFATPADRALNSGSFVVTATASSGLVVSFSSGTLAVCTVTAGGTVTLVASGTCTLHANQAGNASFAAAPTVSRSFNITAALPAQSISFAPLPDRPLDGGSFTLAATASSGLAVSYSSLTPAVCTVSVNSVTVLATGLCTLAADQSGVPGYLPAPQVTQSFNVTAASGGGDADVPTLPEWATILMAMFLLSVGLARKNKDKGR
ncbi:MAG: ExeM/NucH family extracellular endonuclease [Rhizobacter sp.]|nr:ExeM/NucH family extracellular endonuclease [Rhizobacter sp.]